MEAEWLNNTGRWFIRGVAHCADGRNEQLDKGGWVTSLDLQSKAKCKSPFLDEIGGAYDTKTCGTCSFTRHWKVGHVKLTAASGQFVTLLFSRTEVGAADGCVPDNDSVAPLLTTVAPYMASLGLTGTGTLVTTPAGKGEYCTHNGATIAGSFTDAASLPGWSFTSHTADYPGPVKMANLTPVQSWNETCGSAQAITAAGLPGATGMISYPGAQPPPGTLQTGYGQNCFAWARKYGHGGLTAQAAASTAPFWQNTEAVKGGPCNDPAAACYTITAAGSARYMDPAKVIAQVNRLQAGQWLTVQAYVLVTGTSPAYTTSSQQWDCTGPVAEHWTNDVERYCWGDYQQILAAVAASGATVTDPLTVATTWGRTPPGMPKP
jgi:hypothetical protein